MRDQTSIRLLNLVEQVPVLLQTMSEQEMSNQPAPGKWSKKEILGHLIDSAANNHRRFILAQIEPQPYRVIRYDQNEWVRLNDYERASSDEIVQLWQLYNRQIVRTINQIPGSKLSYTCILDGLESVTLEWLIDDYLSHLEHHLRQIFPEQAFILFQVPLK
jgi:hypothetical protein